ncbi:hypothetical protein C805_00735 [Eubacterium sp. 14-2]|nr:hypothetical protein C805_00735 [Eubacterium sp. 14-2]
MKKYHLSDIPSDKDIRRIPEFSAVTQYEIPIIFTSYES